MPKFVCAGRSSYSSIGRALYVSIQTALLRAAESRPIRVVIKPIRLVVPSWHKIYKFYKLLIIIFKLDLSSKINALIAFFEP